MKLGAVKVTGYPPTIGIKRSIWVPHLRNAVNRHVALCSLEADDPNVREHETFEAIKDEWISCIVSSAAAADAYVNQLADNLNTQKGLGDSYWQSRNRKLNERLKLLLHEAYDTEINLGEGVFQQAQLVFDTRNACMHFRPHYEHEEGQSTELENKLPRRTQNPKFEETAAFFPCRCISSAYAHWAVEAIVNYIEAIDKISEQNNAEKTLGPLRDRISAAM